MTTSTKTPDLLDKLHAPDDVAAAADLRAAGLSAWALSVRCRPGGAWQRPLPGVVQMSASPPTPRQRLRAALTYGGAEVVATGVAALREHGLAVREDGLVHLLAPTRRRITGTGYVVVERTARPPDPEYPTGLAVAPVVRAAIDAARRTTDPQRLRAVLLAPISAGRCGVGQLMAELDDGNQRGSAGPRTVLTALAAEQNTLTRARARRLLRDTPLPEPEWGVTLRARGRPVAVDAWWPHVRLAWIITDSAQPDDCPHPLSATGTGTTVVSTDLRRLCDHPDAVGRQLVAALLHSGRRAHDLRQHCASTAETVCPQANPSAG